MRRPAPADDAGAAVVDFVLVSVLLVTLFGVVFQIGLALHTRTVLVALAAEGARYGANADVTSGTDVASRTRAAVAEAFTPAFAARSTITPVLGGPVVEVRITAPLPLAFVLTPIDVTVSGHALEEAR